MKKKVFRMVGRLASASHYTDSSRCWLARGFVILLMPCLISLPVHSAPALISYQGHIPGITGSTNLDLTVDLWDWTYSNNSHLWNEVHPDVPILNGYFSIVLGGVSPGLMEALIEDPTCYIEVSAIGVGSTGRQMLLSVPYVLKSKNASLVQGEEVFPIGIMQQLMGLGEGGTNAFSTSVRIPDGSMPGTGAYAGKGVIGLFMDRYEVSLELWQEVRAWALNNGYPDLPLGSGKAVNHPVHSINGYDVLKWCNARSEMEGRVPCYYTDSFFYNGSVYRQGEVDISNGWVQWNEGGYRIPTSWEWIYSAHGGNYGTLYPWGNSASRSRFNFDGDPVYSTNSEPYTCPVQNLLPNGYGLHNMYGNVSEFFWGDADTVENGYTGWIGGSWKESAWLAITSASLLDGVHKSSGFNYFGFRCAYKGTKSQPYPDRLLTTIPAGENSGIFPTAGSSYTLTVGDPLLMDAHEVTLSYWNTVRDWAVTNGYTDLPVGAGIAGDHPVQMINWYDAVKWCNARSERDGFLTPCYYTDSSLSNVYRTGQIDLDISQVDGFADGFRLPTLTEWHYASYGGVSSVRYPWGNTISHANANYKANGAAYSYDTSPYTANTYHPSYNTGVIPYTSPVGSFPANPYGLYDLVGNVREWCWNEATYQGSLYGTTKGGSFGTDADGVRPYWYIYYQRDWARSYIGFRAVRPEFGEGWPWW